MSKVPEPHVARIRVLDERVSRLIAAGEVIDRPFSVVRELLDNSLDAGATELTLVLEGGGIDLIRVRDNGRGMDLDDLRTCHLPHATSKISDEGDIYRVETLGFRGEALSAIGSCSRMSIESSVSGEQHGNRIVVHGGDVVSVEPCPGIGGTIVNVTDLFFNMPARRKFLKTPQGEQGMCRSIFIDKALPFHDTAFRLFNGKELKLFLPAAGLLERIGAAYGETIPDSGLLECSVEEERFSIRAIIGRLEVKRKDKKLVQVFVNRRRIYEYSLQQAVEYGYSGYMPGKDNPVAFIFIDIDPELVDFNIHPSKKECRIRVLPQIHQALVRLISSSLSRFAISMNPSTVIDEQESRGRDLDRFDAPDSNNQKNTSGQKNDAVPGVRAFETLKSEPLSFTVGQNPVEYGVARVNTSNLPDSRLQVRYIGQVFDLFLVAECNDRLFIVDQHAAHEKVIYEKLVREKHSSQELLFPIAFDVSTDEKDLLLDNIGMASKLGFGLERTGPDTFEITSIPEHLLPIGEDELVRFLKSLNGSFDEMFAHLTRLAACRSAIKEGEAVDSLTAIKLLEEAFALGNARCPHGRPIWHEMTKDALYNLVGRK